MTFLLCLGLVVPDGCSFPHNWGPWKVCRVSHLATSRALDTQHCCTLLCSLFKPALSRIGEALVLLQHNQDDLNWLALSFASCCSQHTEITAISRTKLWTLWLAIATRIMIMLQGYANCWMPTQVLKKYEPSRPVPKEFQSQSHVRIHSHFALPSNSTLHPREPTRSTKVPVTSVRDG